MKIALEAGAHTLELAEELGCAGVPIDGGQLVNDGVDATLAPLRDRGLAVAQIGCFMFNPLSTDTGMQQEQEQLLTDAIDRAADTGCHTVVIGPGNYDPSHFGDVDARNFEDDALDLMAAALKPRLEQAAGVGACLSIEPYLKGCINGPERFKALHERCGSPDHLRANIDPSSLYDFHDALFPAAKVAAVCDGFAGHVGVVHIKEVGLDPGFHLHMGLKPVGQGHTDWGDFIDRITPHTAPDTWCILEHIATPEEARATYAALAPLLM